MFSDFNARMFTPRGFHRPRAAKHREWKTQDRQSAFHGAEEPGQQRRHVPRREGVFQFTTIPSQGQFNTAINSYRDRFRGVFGTMVLRRSGR
jgi:formate dehydrogenase major subunit